MVRLIVAVAIREKGDLVLSLPRPYRHPDIISKMSKIGVTSSRSMEYGFLDSSGRFLSRSDALDYIKSIKDYPLIENITLHPSQLYSENLW